VNIKDALELAKSIDPDKIDVMQIGKDVGKEVADYAKPQLKELGKGLVANFQERFSQFVDAEDLDRFKELSQEAMDNETKALLATDPDIARQYTEAAKSNIRSLETLSLAAEVAKDAQTASMFMEALSAVLDAFKGMAAGVLKIAVKGVISGVVGSVSDGAGLGEALQGGLSEFSGMFG